MTSISGYAVVSCHAERVNDDRIWRAFERLLRRRPGGFPVTALLRPPAAGEDEGVWLARARTAASLGPLGHHTHWGGVTQARPVGDTVAADVVRDEIDWLREHDLAPGYYCGGGWYMDAPLAEVLASNGYVDCTATTFRQGYLSAGAARLQLDGPARVELPGGGELLELPATHSLGMLARSLHRLPGVVHVHFHDWELVDRRRALALEALLQVLRLRRRPIGIGELARIAADAPARQWPTIAA